MRALCAFGLFALLAGCEKTSALYCEKNPDKCPPAVIDGPISSSCTDDTCRAMNPQLPICIDTTTCVECRMSTDCAEPTGVCDLGTNTCRGCMANDECPTGVCVDANHTCASPTNVAYVGGTGSSTSCTIDAPCATLELALLRQPRPAYIVLVDTVTETNTVTFDGATTVDIRGGNHLIHFTGIGLTITDQADVTISNVEIAPSTTQTDLGDDCILLESGTSGAPTLHLVHATIHGCGGDTVDITAGRATIDQSELHHAGYGIEVLGNGTATITHAIVHHNLFAGISVGSTSTTPVLIQGSVIAFNASSSASSGMNIGSSTTTVNTIVAKNGSSSGSVGGIYVTDGTSTFEFVTVSDNFSGVTPNRGMSCNAGTGTVKNSIITGNLPSGICVPTYTFTDFPSATMSNRSGDPMFIPGISDPNDAHFYRLQSTSMAIGGAAPDPNVPKDIDGDSRDSNTPDMGADEYH